MKSRTLKRLLLLALIVVLIGFTFDLHPATYPQNGFHLYEDLSFIFFRLSGCLPWGLCQ